MTSIFSFRSFRPFFRYAAVGVLLILAQVWIMAARAEDTAVKPASPATTSAPVSAVVSANPSTLANTAAPAVAPAPARPDVKIIDRKSFTLKLPAAWKEDTSDPHYKSESHFTINSPDPKNSYVSFEIVDKASDALQLLSSTVKTLDGSAVSPESKTMLASWGQFKATGLEMKGKILGMFPGGIQVYILSSEHHSIIVTEYYWAKELKDLQPDLDYIAQNFVMKD